MKPWRAGWKREINDTDVVSVGNLVAMPLKGAARSLKQQGRDSIIDIRGARYRGSAKRFESESTDTGF